MTNPSNMFPGEGVDASIVGGGGDNVHLGGDGGAVQVGVAQAVQAERVAALGFNSVVCM